MKKIIQGTNSSENKSKSNILDYIDTMKWKYEDGPKPKNIVNEPRSVIPGPTQRLTDKQKTTSRGSDTMSYKDQYDTYFNKKSPKYYNRPKSKSNGSGSVDIAWELPHEKEEDLYGTYLDLIKRGDLLPGTSFEKFEKDYSLFGLDVLTKKKRLDDQVLSNAMAKIDNAMSGIASTLNLGGGGPVKNRPKEPTIKKLNIADYFKLGMTVAELTPQEREMVSELIKKTLSRKPEN